ncbi:MAG TPA: FAD-binding protein, partial [Smithellaceae bacterium]|nr:FAD-binding protein [Smithellaceae bacterium]
MKNYNVLIIGSGPAGLFSAIELEKLGLDKIAIVDRNPYPAGGLLNDGKLNFDYRVGFDIDELQIDRARAEKMMQEIKKVLTRFPRCKQVTFINGNGKLAALVAMASEHGAQFIAPEQWHWGTDNGKALVDYLRGILKKTDFLLGTEVSALECRGVNDFRLNCLKSGKKTSYRTRALLAAPGRSGAYWFRDAARAMNIHHNFGPIDVGIRLELNRKFYDAITDIVYDPKFIFKTSRHGDKVRTFCTNPGGRVRVENYGDFKLINGDAFSGRKTPNTNFALINTVALTKPLSDTTEFGQRIAKQFYLLGGGKPIMQRVGDFREGRRSSEATFNSATRHFEVCKATGSATPGDISLAMPARIMDNLWESLKKLDKIVPGILHPSTLIYAPEIKFFDTQYPTDCN